MRGAKVELEEAGEDVDGMATSVSSLQEKLLALTHGKVNIMADNATFKNTTQILREMSEAWEEMTDIERAAALELMGGKRQANILASIIKNYETVDEVIETSLNSQNSAYEENAKWLDSIEGRTTQFTNALQTMWQNALGSDTIKNIVSLGTELIKLVDTLGLIPSILLTIAAVKTGKFFLPKAWAALSSSIKTSIAAMSGEAAAIEALNGAKVKAAIMDTTSISNDVKEAAVKAILTGEIGDIDYVVICNTEQLDYSGAYKLNIVVNSSNGVSVSNEVILYA